jgi:hypothetical protein
MARGTACLALCLASLLLIGWASAGLSTNLNILNTLHINLIAEQCDSTRFFLKFSAVALVHQNKAFPLALYFELNSAEHIFYNTFIYKVINRYIPKHPTKNMPFKY